MKKKKKNFNRITFAGFVKNSLMMKMKKVRDHCHLTSKLRDAAHWSCKYNSNLRGYDSHLIFDELKNFDVKIDVIPNRLKNT